MVRPHVSVRTPCFKNRGVAVVFVIGIGSNTRQQRLGAISDGARGHIYLGQHVGLAYGEYPST